MSNGKKKKPFLIAGIILSVVLIGSGVAGTITKKPTEDEPSVIDTPIETPGDNTGDNTETPDTPDNEILGKIELTLDNVIYENSNGIESDENESLVTMADVSVTNENIDGTFLKLRFLSGCTVSINVDLSKYDIENATHLTFWFGSEPDYIEENGYAKFVQNPSETVFSKSQSLVSSDATIPEGQDNYTRFGEWRKFEIPIADALEFYETNGRITLFNFSAHRLSQNSLGTYVYLANVQFENLAQ